jgi:hypothetical protein
MKKLLMVFAVTLFLFSCAEDIVVEPPNSLRGFYIGRYYVTQNYSSAGAITDYALVEWSFTDANHVCDVFIAEGQDFNLCNFRGAYTLEAVLDFDGTEKNDVEVCDDEFLPTDEFTVQWINVEEGNDTLIIAQLNGETDVLVRAIMEKQPDQNGE